MEGGYKDDNLGRFSRHKLGDNWRGSTYLKIGVTSLMDVLLFVIQWDKHLFVLKPDYLKVLASTKFLSFQITLVTLI